jgi:hypothetical protein
MNVRGKSTLPVKPIQPTTAQPAAASAARPAVPSPPPAAAPTDSFEQAKAPTPMAAALTRAGGVSQRASGLLDAGRGLLKTPSEVVNSFGPSERRREDRIGTTGRGIGSLPQAPPEEAERPARRDPFAGSGRGPGQGVKIGTGEAASKGKGPDHHHHHGRSASQKEKDNLDYLYRESKRMADEHDKADKLNPLNPDNAQKPHKGKINPNPDAEVGGYVPKHPLGDPWSDFLRRPQVFDPAVDPRLEEAYGPSGVLKQRDQAVDPGPDSDPVDEGGARRAILSTTDAVTDPLPDLAGLDGLDGQRKQ